MNADQIFVAVLDAMQSAEEIDGPDGIDYVRLMDRIAKEAQTRRANYLHLLVSGLASTVDDEDRTLQTLIDSLKA